MAYYWAMDAKRKKKHLTGEDYFTHQAYGGFNGSTLVGFNNNSCTYPQSWGASGASNGINTSRFDGLESTVGAGNTLVVG